MTNFHYVSVPIDKARQRIIAALLWSGFLAISVFLFFFNPASPANQWFPKCPFRLLTGLQCPGCGSTRAFHQLLHLHPVEAFELNPLVVMTLPFIVYGFLGLYEGRHHRQPSSPRFHSIPVLVGVVSGAGPLLGVPQHTLVPFVS